MPLTPIILLGTDLLSWGYSGAVIDPGDGFVIGETIPDVTNASLIDTSQDVYSGSLDITGTSDPNNPLDLSNLRFPNIVTWRGGYVKSDNSEFNGGPGSFDTGTVNMTGNYTGHWTFNRCKFSPTDPSHYMNAIHGHDYTVIRSEVTRTVDGFGVFNSYNRSANVHIFAVYAHDFARFTAPSNGIVHPSDTETHNDFIQVQGEEDVEVQGCAVHGYTKHYVSSLAASRGYDVYADGSTPAGVLAWLDQGILIQQNVKVPNDVSGIYYSGNYHIWQNWFWGTNQSIRIATRTDASYTPYDASVHDNLWMTTPYDNGGSLHYYAIRGTNRATINGITYPTTGGTADTFNNRYDTNTSIPSAYRGTPVIIRADAGV